MLTSDSIEKEQIRKVCSLFSVLSKDDSITIFMLASKGLKSDASMFSRLGLSKKTYYSRLRLLLENGLIHKSSTGEYLHTTFGDMVYMRHLMTLVDSIDKIKKMKMIDVLKRDNGFSEKEILDLERKIGIENNSSRSNTLFVPGITSDDKKSSINTLGRPGEELLQRESRIKIAWTYEEIEQLMVSCARECGGEILIALRKPDERLLARIVENCVYHRPDKDITLKVLLGSARVPRDNNSRVVNQYSDATKEEDRGNMDRAGISDGRHHIQAFGHAFDGLGHMQIKKAEMLPFSMIIIDGRRLIIEAIRWKKPDQLGVMFLIEGEANLCKQFLELFNETWYTAAEFHIDGF